MNDPAPAAPATPAEAAPVSAIEAMYGKPAAAAAPPAAPPAEPPASDPPAEADPPAADPPVSDPPSDQAEEVEVSTVAELAEHLQVEPDWLKTLKVSEKVNGNEVQFSIADALATHRKVQAADTYLADAKTKAKALLDESTQQKQAWATSVAEIGSLLKEVETDINRDAGVLTEKLKQEDPALYAVKQNDLRERRERLSALRAKAQSGIQAAAQRSAQEQSALMQKRLPEQRRIFLERNPDWDPEKDAPAVAKFLADDGFTTQEINSLAHDGRLLTYIFDSMRKAGNKTKLEAAKKKVVKIPKVKPGPKSTAQPKPNGAAKTDPVSVLYGG